MIFGERHLPSWFKTLGFPRDGGFGGVHLGGHSSRDTLAYGEMHIPEDEEKEGIPTSLLIGSKGGFPVEPFQLKVSSTW